MHKINWKALLISLAISLGTGGLSAALTAGSMEKYKTMYKPPLAPPGWLFPIVWTILFILMGVAAYLVYETEADEEDKQNAYIFYGAQLIVNAAWTIIYFRFQAYIFAFAWLILLWYLILMTIRSFWKINATAGKLLLPYLLWVTFAAYLNLAIAIHYWNK